MLRTISLLILAAALVSGCGKKETPPPPAAPAPAGQSVSSLLNESPGAGNPAATPAPAPAAPAPAESAAPAAAASGGGTVDPVLKAAIHKYFGEQGSAPQSWDELVRGKYLSRVPLGPNGKPIDFNQFVYSMVNSK